ncbi:unnamed protein product [Amoebophrya sp. A120]|nr:unnamed protein product [Amoebophrya sp. A120]|eukprot:GSA120T00012844001.1
MSLLKWQMEDPLNLTVNRSVKIWVFCKRMESRASLMSQRNEKKKSVNREERCTICEWQ